MMRRGGAAHSRRARVRGPPRRRHTSHVVVSVARIRRSVVRVVRSTPFDSTRASVVTSSAGVELEARRAFVDDDDGEDDDGEDGDDAWMRARGCVRRRARTIVASARRARGRDGAWRFAFLSDATRGTGTGTGTGDATRRGGGE
jgi:hypothetical protein